MEEVAPLIRRRIEPKTDKSYPELGVRCFGKGTFHKPALEGMSVGSKKLYSIEPGDMVFSNVFAWEGAVAIVREADKGRFGSHRFITCIPKPGLVTAEYLNFYFQTPEGLDQLGQASPGGAGRNRTLGLKALAKLEVPVPSYEYQRWFDGLREKVDAAKKLIAQNQKEREALLPSVLNEIFNGENNGQAAF